MRCVALCMNMQIVSDGRMSWACCVRSAKAFIALHSAMQEKKVYALARFVRTAGAAPRYGYRLETNDLDA